MTRRVLAIAIAALLLLGGCANETPETSGTAPVSAAVSPTASPAGTQAPSASPEASETPAATTAPTASATPETSATPAASATPQATPAATETPAATAAPEATESPDAPQPYSIQTADTVLTVTGDALTRPYYFTLEDLQLLGGTFEADYFSRGKEPQEETNHFIGIRVDYLLDTVVGAGNSASSVRFVAADGYGTAYSMDAVRAVYLNEMDPEAELYMILAWSQDGETFGALRLVMGQTIEGEYNRTFWVRDVVELDVQP